MYCPQCGQHQVSDMTRFCSRCGFLLEGTTAVLAAGGATPVRYVQPGFKQLSPRSKGVRQGAIMMLSTILLVPIIAIISVFILGHPEIIVSLSAIGLFVGGLFRILYALIMEDANPEMNSEQIPGYACLQCPSPTAHHAACRRRRNTTAHWGDQTQPRFISLPVLPRIRRVCWIKKTSRILNRAS